MYIKTDVTSLKLLQQTRLSENLTTQSISKLSTGLEFNSASHNSVSLSVSNRLKGLSNVSQKGLENVHYALDLLTTMNSGAAVIKDMLQHLRTLTIKSQNGALSTSDQKAMQQEFSQILTGIDQISESTSYNNIRPINNSALKFNGTDSYVEFGQILGDLNTSSHTFESKFTVDKLPTSGRSVVMGFQGFHHGFQVSTGGKLVFETWFDYPSGITDSFKLETKEGFIKEGESYQAIATLDTENRMIHLYVNGNEIGSGKAFPEGASLYKYSSANYGNLRLGTGNKPGEIWAYPLDGSIESARVYSKALSSEQVSANYSGNTTQDSLAAEWIASNAWGNTMYDTANVYNGTFLNNVLLQNGNLKVRSGSSEEDVSKFDLTNLSSKGLGLYSLSIDDPNAIEKIDAALNKLTTEQNRIGSLSESLTLRQDTLEKTINSSMSAYQGIQNVDTFKELSNISKEQIKLQTSLSLLEKNNAHKEITMKLLQQ
ncbi:LamG-like jellyroll fold domain-containing protein [Priestia megaterium]